MGKFGNTSGGAGKRVISSTNLPDKARGKVAHVPQKASSFSGKTGMTRKDGGTAFSDSKDATNPVPGRFDNDSMGDKKPPAKAYAGMPVATGLKSTKRVNGGGSTRGFVDKRAREFSNYR